MRVMRTRAILSLGLVAACFFLCHCSARPPRTTLVESDAAHALAEGMLETVLAVNADLDAIKGIGRIKLQLENQPDTFRAIWIGGQPDKFLLKLLALTGQPIVSFACDGKNIYLLFHAKNKLHHRRATVNGLKRIVGIDITVADLLNLICGRIPVHQEGSVRLEETADSGPLLILDGKGRNCIETISLDIDRTAVRAYERRERNGKLIFRVLFEKLQETDGFRLPESITVQDDNGGMIHIAIERAWANPELTDDQFVLDVS